MELPAHLTDRYELTSHLARGGMADVYQGRDSLLGRKIAVKILHSQLSADEAFVKRFRREAQAAANLTHPNIVGIYDWGQLDSTYFIVMELVEGRSLRDVLKSEGALLPRRAVEIAAEVAAALSVAHRSGLVHRDIKPGNILLSADGTVKVTDFGIARAWDDSQELTRTGAVMGTATYFSPEQAQGAPADERSD
ncbi:MAG: protein kinase, partial [Acidimicrobiia bacterium]|nr:protein kinase [Acidimicrobiia bacterium]